MHIFSLFPRLCMTAFCSLPSTGVLAHVHPRMAPNLPHLSTCWRSPSRGVDTRLFVWVPGAFSLAERVPHEGTDVIRPQQSR